MILSKKRIGELFSQLQSSHGFVLDRLASNNHRVVFVRQEQEEIMTPLVIDSPRTTEDLVNVYMWVAPLHFVDDSLENLGVGYKVVIGSGRQTDDLFYAFCQQKIVNFLSCVAGMALSVQKELTLSNFTRKRFHIYNKEKKVILLLTRAAEKGNFDAQSIITLAKQFAAKGKGSVEQLEQLCLPHVASLIQQDFLDSETKEFYKDDADLLTCSVAGHCYIKALAEKSFEIST